MGVGVGLDVGVSNVVGVDLRLWVGRVVGVNIVVDEYVKKKRRLLIHVISGGVTFEVSSPPIFLFICVTQKRLPVYAPVFILWHVTVLLVKLS